MIRGVRTKTQWGFRLTKLALLVLVFGVVAAHLTAYLAEYDEGPALQASYLANQGYALYSQIVLNKPPLLIWWLQAALRFAGTSLYAARYAVLLVTTLGYAALGAFARAAFGRLAGVATMTALWFFPTFLMRMACVTQDLPALALLTLSLWAAVRYRRHRRAAFAAASGAAYGCAVGIHPLMIFGIVPALVLLLWPRTSVQAALRQGVRPALAFSVSAAAVTAAWLVPVASGAFVTWVYHYNVAPLGPGLQAKTAANGARLWEFLLTQHGLATLAAGVAVLLLASIRRQRPALVAILLWLGLLLGYMLRLEPLWGHYLLLLLPPLSLLIGGGVASAADIAGRRYPVWRTVINRGGVVAVGDGRRAWVDRCTDNVGSVASDRPDAPGFPEALGRSRKVRHRRQPTCSFHGGAARAPVDGRHVGQTHLHGLPHGRGRGERDSEVQSKPSGIGLRAALSASAPRQLG